MCITKRVWNNKINAKKVEEGIANFGNEILNNENEMVLEIFVFIEAVFNITLCVSFAPKSWKCFRILLEKIDPKKRKRRNNFKINKFREKKFSFQEFAIAILSASIPILSANFRTYSFCSVMHFVLSCLIPTTLFHQI